MNPPDPENHNRYIVGYTSFVPCRCNGTGRIFGGFATCWYGQHGYIDDLQQAIERAYRDLEKIGERDANP